MGRASKFTSEQDAHIATYHDALEKCYRDNKKGIAAWKVEKAKEILASPLFKDKMPTQAEDPVRGTSPGEWHNVGGLLDMRPTRD